jgi:hypothetical protein
MSRQRETQDKMVSLVKPYPIFKEELMQFLLKLIQELK